MYMCRSLLIFSNVNYKMAARQPYWNFWFPDSNFSLALNINCKLKWHNTYIYGLEPINFQRRHFQNGHLVAILDFFIFGLTLLWLWISTPNFSGKVLMYMGNSLTDFQWPRFLNGCLVAILDFSVSGWHGFGSVTQVCFGISVSNFMCMSFVVVGRSLTIVSYVTFKMAALWFWTMPPSPMGRGYPSRSLIYNF